MPKFDLNYETSEFWMLNFHFNKSKKKNKLKKAKMYHLQKAPEGKFSFNIRNPDLRLYKTPTREKKLSFKPHETCPINTRMCILLI